MFSVQKKESSIKYNYILVRKYEGVCGPLSLNIGLRCVGKNIRRKDLVSNEIWSNKVLNFRSVLGIVL